MKKAVIFSILGGITVVAGGAATAGVLIAKSKDSSKNDNKTQPTLNNETQGTTPINQPLPPQITTTTGTGTTNPVIPPAIPTPSSGTGTSTLTTGALSTSTSTSGISSTGTTNPIIPAPQPAPVPTPSSGTGTSTITTGALSTSTSTSGTSSIGTTNPIIPAPQPAPIPAPSSGTGTSGTGTSTGLSQASAEAFAAAHAQQQAIERIVTVTPESQAWINAISTPLSLGAGVSIDRPATGARSAVISVPSDPLITEGRQVKAELSQLSYEYGDSNPMQINLTARETLGSWKGKIKQAIIGALAAKGIAANFSSSLTPTVAQLNLGIPQFQSKDNFSAAMDDTNHCVNMTAYIAADTLNISPSDLALSGRAFIHIKLNFSASDYADMKNDIQLASTYTPPPTITASNGLAGVIAQTGGTQISTSFTKIPGVVSDAINQLYSPASITSIMSSTITTSGVVPILGHTGQVNFVYDNKYIMGAYGNGYKYVMDKDFERNNEIIDPMEVDIHIKRGTKPTIADEISTFLQGNIHKTIDKSKISLEMVYIKKVPRKLTFLEAASGEKPYLPGRIMIVKYEDSPGHFTYVKFDYGVKAKMPMKWRIISATNANESITLSTGNIDLMDTYNIFKKVI